VFHTAFYLLLIGAVVGQVFGFVGQVSLPEGSAFADTRIAYDAAKPGRWFGIDGHRGFVATLEDFDVSYFDDFTPRDFVSTVTIADGGQPVRTAEIRVNHPLRHDGMTLYQTGFGFAPHVVVRTGDQVLLDERVLLAPGGGGNLWTGTAKVKFNDPEQQIALDLVLAPDARRGADGQPRLGPDPRPRNPVLVSSLYFGELGLERPLPASDFERGDGPVDTAMLRPGSDAALADGSLTVEFGDLGYWSGLQVSHAPGRWLLLLGSVLLMVGLIPSLYSYRRRIWVEATPSGDGSSITVAGVALQRKSVFAEEFAAVTAALREAVDARPQSAAPSPTQPPSSSEQAL
jgi:cytochrome c biogenesis protein